MFIQYPDEEYLKSEMCGVLFRFYSTVVILHLVWTIPGHLTLVYVISLWNISNTVQGIHSCWCVLAVTAIIFSQWTLFPGCFDGKWYIVVWWIMNLVVRMSMTCQTAGSYQGLLWSIFPLMEQSYDCSNNKWIHLGQTCLHHPIGLTGCTTPIPFTTWSNPNSPGCTTTCTSGTTPIPFRIYVILVFLIHLLVMALSYGGIMYKMVKSKLTIRQVALQPATGGTVESVTEARNTQATSKESIILSCTASLSLKLLFFFFGTVFAYLGMPKVNILTPNVHLMSVFYAQMLIFMLCSTDPIIVPLSSRDFRKAFSELLFPPLQ